MMIEEELWRLSLWSLLEKFPSFGYGFFLCCPLLEGYKLGAALSSMF